MRKLIGTGHVAQLDLRAFTGRIFFVSDVHGHFTLLDQELEKRGFNKETDILISGGDWTDRGPESEHVLDFLYEPWVHSIRGNHEQLFIGAVDEVWEGRNTNCLLTNGGMWVINLNTEKTMAIYDMFKSLPLGIELLLPYGRKAGVVHAECPYNDWDKFVSMSDEHEVDHMSSIAQWSRVWYNRQYQDMVSGVDFVLVGHTPTDSTNIEKYGNMIFTDAGCFFSGKLNLIELNEEFYRSVK